MKPKATGRGGRLDQRYRQADWLQQVRRWPPQPTEDLMAFLALEAS